MDYFLVPFSVLFGIYAERQEGDAPPLLQIWGSITEKGWKSGSLRLSLVFHLDAARSSILFQRSNIKEMSLFPDKKKARSEILYADGEISF
jgi:hypothetical protein